MNVFQRAIKYLCRKKVRSLVLFIILTVLSVSFLLCLAIRNSANAAAREIEEEFGASFTIAVDPQKIQYEKVILEDGSARMKPITQTLSPDVVKSFLEIEDVVNYRSDFTTIGAYFDLEIIPGFYEYLLNSADEESQKLTEQEKQDYYVRGHLLDAYCVLNSETQEYFESGAFELIEGRHINLDDNSEEHLAVLISDTVAEKNNLKVGDWIIGENRANIILTGDPEDVLARHRFQIVGIYKINFRDEPSIYTVESEIAENFIFSGFVTDNVIRSVNSRALGQENASYLHGISKLTLFVSSPKVLDRVMEKVTETDLVDWNFFDIYEDDTVYRERVKPLQFMITLTTGLLAVFILGGLIILSLLTRIWTKSRNREISIYVSIGLKKRNILRQLLIEILLLVFAALIAGGIMACPLADRVGNMVADSVVSDNGSEKYRPIRKDNAYFRIETVSSEPVKLKYSIMIWEIAGSCAAILAVAVCSVVLSAGEMLRLKPRELFRTM